MAIMASMKIVTPVLITLLIVMFPFSEAREFVVGGQENSWSFPTSSDSLNSWAQKGRFEVGDILSTLSLSLSHLLRLVWCLVQLTFQFIENKINLGRKLYLEKLLLNLFFLGIIFLKLSVCVCLFFFIF